MLLKKRNFCGTILLSKRKGVFFIYRHTPKHKNAYGIFLSAISLTLAAFMLAIGIKYDSDVSSVFRACALLLFICGSLVCARFVLYGYEYRIEEGIFTVREKRFKKSVVTARFLLSEIDEITEVKKRKKPKSGFRARYHDYRVDLFPKGYQILHIRGRSYCNDGEEICLLVSLDERMISLLRGRGN